MLCEGGPRTLIAAAALDGYTMPCCGGGGSGTGPAWFCGDVNLYGAAGVDHNQPQASAPVVPRQCTLQLTDDVPATACDLAEGAYVNLQGTGLLYRYALAGTTPQAGVGGTERAESAAHAVAAEVSPLPRFRPDDVADRQHGCAFAVDQHITLARNFREEAANIDRQYRALGGQCRDRDGNVSLSGCRQETMRTNYDMVRERMENSANDVVRLCLPRAASDPTSVDALAAGVFRMAAVPGKRPGPAHMTEDLRKCAARVDLARHMCRTLPHRVVEPRAQQLRALCNVDVGELLAGRLGDPDERDWDRLREAFLEGRLEEAALLVDAAGKDPFRFGPEDDPLGTAAAELRRRAAGDGFASAWCPVMMRETARELEALRERFVLNPALGAGEAVMCGNLSRAAACLGADIEPPRQQQQQAPTGPAAPSEPQADPEDAAPEGDPLRRRVRRTPPGQVNEYPEDLSDTVNVFADLLAPSKDNKDAVITKLQEMVRAVRSAEGAVEVERPNGSEIISNTGSASAEQHQNLCFVHCHGRSNAGTKFRDEEDGAFRDRTLLNCRIYTPPEPQVSCTRAVISVVDETPLGEGDAAGQLQNLEGPAYDVIEGMLSQFQGCNVRRGGTEHGVPKTARNVRLGPFEVERWRQDGARYGFCYVEKDQLVNLGDRSVPETGELLWNHRMPSADLMLAFATSHGRQGGRMAQRECKMLLDLQQNVCRTRFSQRRALERLPGWQTECAQILEPVPTGEVLSIQVPILKEPDCQRRVCGPGEDASDDCCEQIMMTVFQPEMAFPRKECELRKIADACGKISSFARGEPEQREQASQTRYYGVPDSSDAHCMVPTAPGFGVRAGASSTSASPATPAVVGLQEYISTQWHGDDRSLTLAKFSLEDGCEAQCLMEHLDDEGRLETEQQANYEACLERCFGSVSI